MKKIPCEECLCLPMCRNRTVLELDKDCSILYDYLMIGKTITEIASSLERLRSIMLEEEGPAFVFTHEGDRSRIL